MMRLCLCFRWLHTDRRMLHRLPADCRHHRRHLPPPRRRPSPPSWPMSSPPLRSRCGRRTCPLDGLHGPGSSPWRAKGGAPGATRSRTGDPYTHAHSRTRSYGSSTIIVTWSQLSSPDPRRRVTPQARDARGERTSRPVQSPECRERYARGALVGRDAGHTEALVPVRAATQGLVHKLLQSTAHERGGAQLVGVAGSLLPRFCWCCTCACACSACST